MTIAVDMGRKATKTNKQICIGSLIKVYTVRYILSNKFQNVKLYTRNAAMYSFLLSCIDRMLDYGIKSQQMILHANLQVK